MLAAGLPPAIRRFRRFTFGSAGVDPPANDVDLRRSQRHLVLWHSLLGIGARDSAIDLAVRGIRWVENRLLFSADDPVERIKRQAAGGLGVVERLIAVTNGAVFGENRRHVALI